MYSNRRKQKIDNVKENLLLLNQDWKPYKRI
jgi:hypothetical protein